MKRINSVYSHLELQQRDKGILWQSKLSQNNAIRRSEPMRVDTYDELVEKVAYLSNYNRDINLFFRGQGGDYKGKEGTTILPNIFRPQSNGRTPVKERFENLDACSEKLRKAISSSSAHFSGEALVKKYPELRWAILQHYGICETPLLDLSHSLHVATSFAFLDNNKDDAMLWLLACLPLRVPFLITPQRSCLPSVCSAFVHPRHDVRFFRKDMLQVLFLITR